MPFVRPKNFQLFYYIHHLYILFIIFLAMHVGNFFFTIILFMMDRFLRFCQSRKTVDVISMKSFPCGVVELVLAKPDVMSILWSLIIIYRYTFCLAICFTSSFFEFVELGYNALSFVFLQVRELSLLQWHPFSVSSSPLDGKFHLSVLVKAVGDWTSELQDTVRSISEEKQNKLTASVEGTYGHELPYHLTYENLILVAGGIGISPFVAIITNVLHRINEGKPCLPRNIFLIWAVKKSEELSLLSTINMESINPSLFNELKINMLIYITREVEHPLESSGFNKGVSACVYSAYNGNNISPLVRTGNKIWSGAYVVSSIFGLIILMSVLNIFYITPFEVTNWWYQGLLILACMLGSVVIFGGAVIGLWNSWEKRILPENKSENGNRNINEEWSNEEKAYKNSFMENLATSTSFHFGSRPNFTEIFGSISKEMTHVAVGVIACGPPSLQLSVAKECRSLSMTRQPQDPIFHFNSHSFSL